MSHNRTRTFIALLIGGLAIAAGISAPLSAFAADSTPGGVVIAQTGQGAVTTPKKVTLAATPTKSRQITVTASPRTKVSMSGGTSKITRTTNSVGTAVFTKLTPGKDYTFTANKKSVRARALASTAPVTNLTVLTTTTPDSVAVSWNHVSSPKTGGAETVYTVTATPQNTQLNSIDQTTKNTAVVLTGLNPDALYTFTVTPHNAIGAGASTAAVMTTTLRSLTTSDKPIAREIKQAPAQSAQPSANTRTIYVCPDTFVEVNSICQKTASYTFSYLDYTYHTVITNLPYTYHTEQTGPAPILDSFETFTDSCPAGYNLEDYGPNGKWCRLYGPAPTIQVKDAPPAGYTDNGTNYTKSEQVKDAPPAGYTDNGSQWVKKDAAPAGYTDNGTEYIATANKIEKVVPA